MSQCYNQSVYKCDLGLSEAVQQCSNYNSLAFKSIERKKQSGRPSFVDVPVPLSMWCVQKEVPDQLTSKMSSTELVAS